MKHTKTPWAQRDWEVIGSYHTNKFICDCTGAKSDEENIANAHHIVHCVNTHDELVSLLTEANKHISRPMDIKRFNDLSEKISSALKKVTDYTN